MTAAVVVAGGAGTRLGGDTPKAFRKLCGKPLVCYAVEALERCEDVRMVVLVVPGSHLNEAQDLIENGSFQTPITIVSGGRHRHESVLAGLQALPDTCEWTAVHDAARPFASPQLIATIIAAARDHGGAIAARRATDTLKREHALQVSETVPRNQIWLAETPQVFRRAPLIVALERAAAENRVPTDEAQAMEWQGETVILVENREPNPKITTPADWNYAEFLIGVADR